AGFAVVVQDCRGCGSSEGECNPFFQEARDSKDTIAWIIAQTWSKGRVGMAGGSYLGAIQWLPANEGPAALQALAPYVTTAQYYQPWTYQGEPFSLAFVSFGLWDSLACQRYSAGWHVVRQP
ncbi:MAG: CocE/NonD family hydrolase, partial [Chloroflexi bacterium]|nr:CocE/NonD family hydrolase [Chloroflexota bacterium]